MEERLFREFWDTVRTGLGPGASSALRDSLQGLKASLHALAVTSAYWSWSSSHSRAHVFVCGDLGYGRIEIELKSATPEDDSWHQTVCLSVLPWSEVTEITQTFIKEGHGGNLSEFRLSEAALRLRGGNQISLLPATGMNNSGGVRVLRETVEQFKDPTVFTGAVIAAQRAR